MLPEQTPQSDWEDVLGSTPGLLTGACRVTIWRHISTKHEYLAIAFTTGARVVVAKPEAGYLLQVFAAWLCPGVEWPQGAYPGPSCIALFEGDLPREADDDLSI